MDSELILNCEKEIGPSFEDRLTEIYTHDFFQLVLEREVDCAKRYDTMFTLAMMDVDHFDTHNERHGVLKANLLLRQIATIIKGNMRQTDLVARYAGSQFAVIMAGTHAEGGVQVLERLQRKILAATNYEITLSIGLSSWPQDANTKKGMLESARKALDQAKAKGHNNLFAFDAAQKPLVDRELPLVLLVDDEPLNLKLMDDLMVSLKYDVIKAANGLEALDIIANHDVDLVLLDVMMPAMDGFEVCRRIKSKELTRMIPVILITSLEDTKSKIRGIESGADDFIAKPPSLPELRARTKSLIKINKLNRNLASIESILFSLANAVEAKCAYTQGHITRVSTMGVQLGRKLGLSDADLEALRLGGALHDVGKIGISEGILDKAEPLDLDEQEIMKTHAEIGYQICLPLEKNLGAALDVIRHHHEKMDGSGYPDGIHGDEISLTARIMAVVDIFDALTTDRPYRKGLPHEDAVSILREESKAGKLDPGVVAAFVTMVT